MKAKEKQALHTITHLVAQYFEGDIEQTELWFDTRNPMLGGISPIAMLAHGRTINLLNFILAVEEANRATDVVPDGFYHGSHLSGADPARLQ